MKPPRVRRKLEGRKIDLEARKQRIGFDEEIMKDAVQRGSNVTPDRVKSELNRAFVTILADLKGPE